MTTAIEIFSFSQSTFRLASCLLVSPTGSHEEWSACSYLSPKLSAEKDEQGEWQIEPAELHRVYEPVPVRNDTSKGEWNDTHQAKSVVEPALMRAEVEQMRKRLAWLENDRERERREASDTIADLRRRLDQSEQERRDKDRQLTALLTDQRMPERRRRWWQLRKAAE